MIYPTTSTLGILAQQVLRIISQRKAIQISRLRSSSRLVKELHFDLVDIVDIILELERCFDITIPDDAPLLTVGDFVDCVAAETMGFVRCSGSLALHG